MELSGRRSICVWAGHPEIQRISVKLTYKRPYRSKCLRQASSRWSPNRKLERPKLPPLVLRCSSGRASGPPRFNEQGKVTEVHYLLPR